MKKSLVICLILSILSITACQQSNQVKSSTDQVETIKIGAILPLTGPIATIGEYFNNALLLAQQNINEGGGIYGQKLEIIIEDTQLNPKLGLAAAKKLIEQERIKYLITVGSPIISSIQPYIKQQKIIHLIGSIDPELVRDNEYSFRILYNLEQATHKLIEFIDINNIKKVAVLYLKSNSLQRQTDILSDSLDSIISIKSYQQGEKDFKTMINKITSQQPDILITLGYAPGLQPIFETINELDVQNLQILGGLDLLDLPDQAKPLAENSIFIVPLFTINPPSTSQHFIESYKKLFNSHPPHQAASTYDAIMILSEAIKSNGHNIEKVKNYLSSLSHYPGVVGDIEILPNGDSRSSLEFATYKDGQVVPYTLE